MVRSSCRKTGNLFLRKHRKWPHSPLKTKWHHNFNQQLAMRDLQQSAIQLQHDDHNQTSTNLLSSLINSFKIHNCEPTPQAYHFLIQTLTQNSQNSQISLLHQIPPLLHHLQHSEKFEIPESIIAHLIRIYGRANQIHEALDLFYRIPNFRCVPSVYLLNTLISVLCSTSEGLKLVPQVLLKSRAMNIRLEDSTFLLLIEALCRINKVGYAVELFNSLLNDGFCIDTNVCSLLLSSLCEQVDVSSSVDVLGFLVVFRRLGFCPGIVDYTNLIRFLVRRGMGMDAFDCLNQMKSEGIKPDIVCYTMVLNGLIEKECFSRADEVFDELLVYGLIPDVYTYNVYIKGLCKQGNLEAGIKMVASMGELGCQPNLITYNIVLNALFKSGEISRGWEVFRGVRCKGIELSLQTYETVIVGLINNGKIIEANGLLEEILEKDLWAESLRVDRIICALCEISARDKALELVERMVRKNMFPGVRGWEALLVGYTSTMVTCSEDTLLGLVN